MPLLQFGTTEEATAAVKELLSASQQPAIDHDKLKQEAMEAVFEQMAVQDFIKRNNDILSNKVFANLAILTQNDMSASQGKPKDWNKFYANLEGTLRNALGRPITANQQSAAQPTAQTTSGSVADKEARKASIVALPVTAARAVTPEEPKQPTREDILARLRKARGQPV